MSLLNVMRILVIAIELVAVKFGNSLFFYIMPNYCRTGEEFNFFMWVRGLCGLQASALV
jgi:hypothetical protein